MSCHLPVPPPFVVCRSARPSSHPVAKVSLRGRSQTLVHLFAMFTCHSCESCHGNAITVRWVAGRGYTKCMFIFGRSLSVRERVSELLCSETPSCCIGRLKFVGKKCTTGWAPAELWTELSVAGDISTVKNACFSVAVLSRVEPCRSHVDRFFFFHNLESSYIRR